MLEVSEDYPSSFMKASSAGKIIRVNLNFHVSSFGYSLRRINIYTMKTTFAFNFIKFIMQGKLFQRCAHLLYCSVLSLGGNVNTRWMSQPYMGSIFHKKSMKYSGQRKQLCELSKFNAFILLGYQTNTNACIVYKFRP